MTHSPEPWKLTPRPGQTWEDGEFTALDAEENGLEGDPFSGVSTEDWKRIVACVNACAGIPTEGLKQMSVANLIMFGRQVLQHPNNVTACALAVAHTYILNENAKDDADDFETRLNRTDE